MKLELNEKQIKLFEFVKQKHKDKVRKYTNEPYYNHLLSVAEIVYIHERDCVEIALCHDLFEDTNCTFTELHKKMVEIGYDRSFAYDVCVCVTELTDVFTKENYPHLNRVKRKKKEAERLGKTKYRSQSVKYADLIDNTSSIVKHDKEFAKTYLFEKEDILYFMDNGNKALFNICNELVKKEINTLNK